MGGREEIGRGPSGKSRAQRVEWTGRRFSQRTLQERVYGGEKVLGSLKKKAKLRGRSRRDSFTEEIRKENGKRYWRWIAGDSGALRARPRRRKGKRADGEHELESEFLP